LLFQHLFFQLFVPSLSNSETLDDQISGHHCTYFKEFEFGHIALTSNERDRNSKLIADKRNLEEVGSAYRAGKFYFQLFAEDQLVAIEQSWTQVHAVLFAVVFERPVNLHEQTHIRIQLCLNPWHETN
jgi:hypothetical protein